MPSISSFLATLDEPARTPAASPDFIDRLIQVESSGNPDAVSPKGAFGLGQAMPETWNQPGYGVTAGGDRSDPVEQRRFATDYYNAMLREFGNQEHALAAYNWGPDNLHKHLAAGGGPEGYPAETQSYLKKLADVSPTAKSSDLPAAKGKPSISAFLATLDEPGPTIPSSNTSSTLKPYRQEALKRFPGLSRYKDVHVLENERDPTQGEFYAADETKDHPNPGFPTVYVGVQAGQGIDAPQPGPADIIVNDMLHYALNQDPALADLKAQFVQNLPPEMLQHERGFYERKLREGAAGSNWATFEAALAGPLSDGIISGYVRGEPEYVDLVKNLAKTSPAAIEAAQGIQDYLKRPPSTGKSISAFLATLDEDERSEFGKGLAGYLLASGPEAIGSFIEAVGVTTGSTWLSRDAANWVHGIGNDPADYAPKVGGWEQVDWDAWDTEPLKVVDQVTDFLSYGLGSGLASTIPPIAGGMAGFAAAGPPGALAGAFGPSYVQNTGPLYADLIEEGVPKEDAGPIALLGGLPIAALDVIFPSGRAKAVLGKAKRDVTRGLAKRLAQEFFRGTWQEGIPEGLQGLLNDVIVYKAAGKDIDWEKTRLAVLNEGTLGAVTGGIIGGVTGVVPDTPRPAVPQPGAEPPAPPPIPEEPVVPPEAEVTPAAATPPTAPPGAPAPAGAPSESVGAIPEEAATGPAPVPTDFDPMMYRARHVRTSLPSGQYFPGGTPATLGQAFDPTTPPAEPTPFEAPEAVEVDTGIAPPQTASVQPPVVIHPTPTQEATDALAGEIPAPTAPALPAGAVVSSPLTEQQRAAEQDFLAIKRLRDVKRQADLEREQAISPEATPVETDPLARLPEVRAFLDKRKNKVTPKALAEALDMTPIQARRVLDHMAAVGDRVQKTPKGYRRQSRANLGPASLAEFISENGGIQDPSSDLGEDGRDWHRRAPFRKKLVRDDGLPVDEMRLRAVERGYPIPGAYDSQESDLLSLLAQDIDSTPTRIYVPEEMAEVQESPRELERERDINRNAMELEADRLGLNPADVISMTDPDLTAAIAGADPEGAEAAAQVLEDEVDRIVWEVLQSESVEEDIQDEIPDIPFPEAAKPEAEPPPGGPDQEADRPPRPEPELEGPPQTRPETPEGGDQAAIAGAGFQPGDPVETLIPVTGEWEAGEFAGTMLDGRVLQVRMHAPTTSGSTGVYGFSPDSVRAPVPKKKAEIARDERRKAKKPPQNIPENIPAPPAEPVSREIPLTTEKTDQGDQVVMPGVAPITDKDRLDQAATGKAKAKVAQKEADEGLFGGPLQPDLVDLAKKPAKIEGPAPPTNLSIDDQLRELMNLDKASIDAYDPVAAVSKFGREWQYDTTNGTSGQQSFKTKREAIEAATAHKKLKQEQVENPSSFWDITAILAGRQLERIKELMASGMSEMEAGKQARAEISNPADKVEEIEQAAQEPEPIQEQKPSKLRAKSYVAPPRPAVAPTRYATQRPTPAKPTRQQVDEKIYRDLEREIQHLAPGLLWQVTPRIDITETDRAMFEASGGDGYPAAYYENGMATFAWDAMRAEGAIPLVSHEVIHYLRDRNFFKPKEWALLEAQSREHWMDRYGLPHEPQNRDVVEEGVAYAFQQWRTDGVSAVGGPVARIFRRLQAFIERLVRGMLGRQTAEDVFQKVAAGKVGRRTRGARQGPGGVSYAAAYHGGPHDFDRFSTDAIGTGEGAQAYGWGLYFAGKESVARYYRDVLARDEGLIEIAGEQHRPLSWANRLLQPGMMPATVKDSLAFTEGWDQGFEDFAADVSYPDGRMAPDYARGYAAATAILESKDAGVIEQTGRLYEVDLAPAEDEYLYWDKPLSEQSEKVFPIIDRDLRNQFQSIAALRSNPTGADVYRRLEAIRGAQGASEILAEAGIPGIKFLDQGSRNAPMSFVNKKTGARLLNDLSVSAGAVGALGQEYRDAARRAAGKMTLGADPTAAVAAAMTDFPLNEQQQEYLRGFLSNFTVEEGTYNYVIFDDRHIDIKRKYAVRREGPGSYQAETEDWAAQVREQFGDPVTAEEINRARGPMYALAGRVQGTPQQEAILERIGQAPREQPIGHRIREGIAAIKDRAGEKFRQAMIDNFDAIAVLEKTGNNGKLLDASVGAYKAARLSRELSSTMHVLLKHGMVGYKNGGFEVVPGHDGGFEGIFHDIADRGLLQLWQGWAIAQRSQRLIGEGREKLLSQADINALLPLSAQYPEFQVAMDKWAAFNKSILDTAEKAGIIDPASRALWENNDYVPFYRMLQEAGGGPTSKRGLVNQRSGIKTLKGGEEAVRDLIENMVMNVAHLVDASYKNVAGVRSVDLGLRSGALEEVGMDWRKQIIPAPQAAKALRDVGVDVQKMDKAQREQWLKVFALQQPRGRDIISVMRGGKPVYYRVNDPMLLASLTSLHEVPFESAVMRIAGTAKSWLTKGVTTFPDFMIRNLMRDTGSAWVVTSGKTGPLKAAKGFAAALNESTSQVAIAAAGGGTIGWYDVEPEAVKKQISLGSSPKNMAHRLWLMWQRIGQATENANRIALYDSLRAAGVSHAEAAYQAKDLMDFSMHGGATSMRALIQVVPFLNARVQGLYKLARGAAENPVGFMLRGGAIMAATLALLADNWDEEDYEALPDWDKDTYYHLFVAGEHFRLPRAFEVGALFSTVPERITRLVFGRDKPKKAAQRALAMFAETFAFDPTPQIVKPMLEQYANRNSFTGAPIVPDRLEGLRPGEQVTDRTSAVAEGLGRLFPNVVSPVRVDSLMRGYLATLGTTLLATTDVAADLYDPVPRPTRRIDEIPVIGGFIRDNPAWSTVYMADFYDFRREVNRFVRSAKELRKQGRGEEALELLRGRPKAVPQAKFTNKVGHTLAKLNTRLRQVRRDRNMAPDEKRRQIDRIIGRRNALAKSAMAKIERHAQP